MKVLVKNIKGLVGVYEHKPGRLAGKSLAHLPILHDAWLAIENGRFVDYGQMADWPGISDWRDLEVIDASGSFLLPGFIDSHTHLVHAGTREGEFVDRINGLTYAEIAKRGGGILNSASKLAEANEEDLLQEAYQRAQKAMAAGTLGFEIKSGYGLSVEAELKMLRVVRKLREMLPVPVKATFLGAHAVPKAYNGDANAYVDDLIERMLPRVAEEQLADYIDVFCEEGYFSVAHTLRIMEAGTRYGLKSKIHMNQFTSGGGVKACVEAGALSLDHLEVLTDDDLQALAEGNTLPVALPGCSFFLGIPYTPVRKIIDAGLPMVLATDYNPGSAPSWNMNLVNSLACTKMNMLPSEAFNASTVNGAAALELEDICGAIVPGFRADFMLTEPIPSFDFMAYAFGENNIKRVYAEGVQVA